MNSYEMSMIVENDLGTLARIALAFRQKMISVQSLHVEELFDGSQSVMNISLETTYDLMENMRNLLLNKEDVHSVSVYPVTVAAVNIK